MMPPQFACPGPLLARGMTVRPECAMDLPALRTLFSTQRWAEFAMLPWDDAAKQALLDQQFDAQQRHYTSAYAHRQFLVLLDRERLAGRLYLGDSAAGDLCVLDILLSPDHRNRGVGTALLAAVQDQAATAGRRVLLEVDKGNPAAGLYRRLGFAAVGDTDTSWRMAWSAATTQG
ncbi:GNAT family N-acetyltransferase [Xanthomonas cassavae CFBP 4642]|uniref:GNAT family N-acetyltransferase n=3 Tax=Xanthomonas cassavae TaxID=56450 RepID=A0ABS8HC26_9XANT|nr:GNAT family N-acetyltransferase [Xanthomonas cassavae]MCC4619709.1 GNAT family N-acetyltransferase [Xanthomonas cassavae CFBP 4642]